MTFHSYNFLGQNFESECIFIPIEAFLCTLADPHHFNADPRIHLFISMQIRIRLLHFNADPDLAPHQNDANLRPVICKPSELRIKCETGSSFHSYAVYNELIFNRPTLVYV
jgi:hypothetical protein